MRVIFFGISEFLSDKRDVGLRKESECVRGMIWSDSVVGRRRVSFWVWNIGIAFRGRSPEQE